MKKQMKKQMKKRYFLLLFWPVSALTLLAASRSEHFAEYIFARRIYPVYHTVLAFFTGVFPFSLAELLLYAVVFLALTSILIWLIHIIRAKNGRFRIVLRGSIHLLCALGLIFFLFVFGCGANYYRMTYADCVGLSVSDASVAELFLLCTELAEKTNAAREKLSAYEDAAGVFSLPCTVDELGDRAHNAIASLGEEISLLDGYYTRPKAVLWSRGMSHLGITGMFFPFTQEANINIDIPDYSIASTMCHELSHMAGFMREDEANFIAYLACTHADDPVLVYSGYVSALIYAGNALYDSAPEQYWKLYARYSEAVQHDLRANSDYWAQFDDAAGELGEQMNDAYLKANNQPEGTKSYGDMVDLLIAEYRQNHT